MCKSSTQADASIVGLGEIEINNALCQIEMDTPLSPETTCRGPFSVFCVKAKEETPPCEEVLATIPEIDDSFLQADLQDCAFDSDINGRLLDDFGLPSWTARNEEPEISCSTPVSPRSMLQVDSTSVFSLSENLFSPAGSDGFYFDQSLSNVSSPHIIESRSPSLMDSNIFNRSFERSFMTPEVRYLLSHYMTHVIDIMTVVSNMKSPWKSLHLPRALQGCGELEAVGTTCNARNALINALLSISAYNLAQKFSGHQNSAEADKWSKAAQKYRFRAVNFLKICLEVDFKQPSKVRYKEILAAMLSMVTIDVRI